MKKKKYLFVAGGGSGGHITPILAVVESLREKGFKGRIIWLAPRHDRQIEVLAGKDIKVINIHTGKLRRFAHWKWWEYITHYKFMLENIRDYFMIILGFLESLYLVLKYKPTACFNKGGFGGLPVGLACWLLRVPYVLHDSDARPGLANKVLSPGASVITTGFKLEESLVNKEKYVHVGIPVRREFYTKDKLSKPIFDNNKPTVMVTGGSLGARRINQIIIECLKDLIIDVNILHVSGEGEYKTVKSATEHISKDRYRVKSFLSNDYVDTIKKSDIVICRAGATSLAELAVARKAAVVIPNTYLGDQIKNIKYLKDAAIIFDEFDLLSDQKPIISAINDLISNKTKYQNMIKNMSKIFPDHAEDKIADFLLKYLIVEDIKS